MQKSGGIKNIKRFIAGTMAAILVMSPPFSSFTRAEEHTYQNPQATSGSGKKVTWDCVWFGEYPQAEVISSAMDGNYSYFEKDLLSEGDLIVDDSLYGQLHDAEEYEWEGNEITVNNVRYRRVGREDAVTTSDGIARAYQWDNDSYHYFRYEPIKWRILQVDEEQSQALLLSDLCLDYQRYAVSFNPEEEEWENWAGAPLRNWLNLYDEDGFSGSCFYNTAFDYEESFAIDQTDVGDYVVSEDGTEEGEAIWDNVFLLSGSDVYNTAQAVSYGLDPSLGTAGSTLRVSSSLYTLAMGARLSTDKRTEWWLRSPGNVLGKMQYVGTSGSIMAGGASIQGSAYSIRPSLRLNLTETDVYSYAGTVCSDGTQNEVAPPSEIPEEPTEPTETPTEEPTETPTEEPTEEPTETPTEEPTEEPTETPTEEPTETPTEEPTEEPTETPTEEPTETPTEEPTEEPTETPDDPDQTELVSRLADPRVAADETQMTGQTATWDCVWFGSYPQAEVVSTQMSENYQPLGKEYYTKEDDLVVSDTIYQTLQNAHGWDENNDITIAKERYHRMKATDAAASTSGGIPYRYGWENDNTYHYFRYQPIKWRVLDKNGTNVLVMADLGLDGQPYNTTDAQVEWGNSTIRSWLNGYTGASNTAGIDYTAHSFYSRAFDVKDQSAILITELSGENGTVTNDKLFLPSRYDVCGTDTAGSYGFTYMNYTQDPARGAKTSLYAKAMGAAGTSVAAWIGNSAWWLRTTETQWGECYDVNTDGTVGSKPLSENTTAVRPAMTISLTVAEDCFYAGTISSDGTEQEIAYPETGGDSGAQIILSNPKIEEDPNFTAKQKVTWDSVWFGSYPQSEVVTTGMSGQYSAVDPAYRANGELVVSDQLYAALEQAAGWDQNGDITINGQKYRRIRQSDLGFSTDHTSPVSYQWGAGNSYHYFKFEPVKWRVLKVDGARALLLADKALDAMPFNENVTVNTWKDVTLRSWLNGYGASLNQNGKDFANNNFMDMAFTEAQQAKILSTELDETDTGISDRIFLLSTTQLTTENYGFIQSYLQKDEARRSSCSLYAKAAGASWSDQEGMAGNVYWWRRCTFANSQESSASLVSCSGDVGTGIAFSTASIAVRPALTLDLSAAGICEYAGTVCSDGTKEEVPYPDQNPGGENPPSDITKYLSNPRVVEDPNVESGQKVTWDSIYFGSYPQAEVITSGMSVNYAAVPKKCMNDKDFIVSDAVYSSLKSAVWDADGNTTVGGFRYRRIKKSDATYAAAKKTDSAYYWQDADTYHYFRYQPIKWRVLKVEGNAALLLSDSILDDRKYHTAYTSVRWENSAIRSWLNGYGAASNQAGTDYSGKSFIGTAFDETQQQAIKVTDVVNRANLVYNTEGGGNTSDRIFLLSESEVYNSADALLYGFAISRNAYDEARQAASSTYAKAMGTSWNTSSTYYGNSWWGLRSPGYNTMLAASVYADGYVSAFGTDVSNENDGIRAALWLDISQQDVYSYNGTVSTYGKPAVPGNTPGDDPGSDDKPGSDKPSGDNPGGNNGNNENNGNSGNNGGTNNGGSEVSVVKVTGVQLDGDSTKLAAGKKMKLAATVTPHNAKTKKLQWSSSNTAYATVSDQGIVAAKKAGAGHSVTIRAQSTDGSKVVASYRIEIVKKAVQSVEISGLTQRLAAGQKMTLRAEVYPSSAGNKKLKWSSSNAKYASVSSKGVVTAKRAGAGKTVTITSKTTDGSGLKASYKIKIMGGKVRNIKLTVASRTVRAGKKRTVKARVSTSGSAANTKLKWSSSNTKYATVSSKGVVKTKAAGKSHTVTITASATDGTGEKAKIMLKIR